MEITEKIDKFLIMNEAADISNLEAVRKHYSADIVLSGTKKDTLNINDMKTLSLAPNLYNDLLTLGFKSINWSGKLKNITVTGGDKIKC